MYIHERMFLMKYQTIQKSKCHCITLCRAANAITAYYDEGLKGLGISVKQFSLLLNLHHLEGASTAELADYVNLERSTVTRNLKFLLERGWVCDIAAPGKRAHCYVVTTAGQNIIAQADKIWERLQEEIQEYLGQENAARMMEIAYRLQDLQKA